MLAVVGNFGPGVVCVMCAHRLAPLGPFFSRIRYANPQAGRGIRCPIGLGIVIRQTPIQGPIVTPDIPFGVTIQGFQDFNLFNPNILVGFPAGYSVEIGGFSTNQPPRLIPGYRLLGGAAFSRLLVLLDSTWHGASISLRASMLSGMALFLKTYETELDDRTFIKRLSAVDPEEIIRRGKMDFSTNKAALRFARVILEKYNSQQRGGRKLPYRFKG